MKNAGLLLLLLTVLWAVDAVLGLGFFWAHDLRHHHLPWRVWAAGEWLDGTVPFWSHDIGSGFPLGADGQTGVFYLPTMALFMLLPPEWAVNASILLHIWWAGLGAFCLARTTGASSQGAAVAAVAFAFSGFLTTHAGYLGMQNASAWVPWAFAFGLNRRLGPMLLSLLAVSAAGHAQVLMITAPVVFAVALFQGLRHSLGGQRSGGGGRRVVTVALAVVPLAIGALLVISPNLMTFDLLPETIRAGGVGPAFANTGSLPLQEVANGVLPSLFGVDRPGDVAQTYFHRGEGYWGSGVNHWEMAFYLGLPTVVLAVLGARVHPMWLALCLVSGLLMLGGNTPLWPLIRQLPWMDGFRFPVRYALLLTLGVAVLAAHGFDRLRTMGNERHRITARVVGAAVILWLAMCVAWLGLDVGEGTVRGVLTAHYEAKTVPPPPPPMADPMLLAAMPAPEVLASEAVPGKVDQVVRELKRSTSPVGERVLAPVLILLAFGALLALRSRIGVRWWGWGVTALLYADLWHFGADYNLRSSPEEVRSTSSALPIIQAKEGLWRTTVVDRRQDPALDTELIQSSMGLVQGTRDVLVPSPLRLVRHEALLAMVGLDVGDKGPQKWDRLRAHPELVDLLGLRWLLSVHDIADPAYPKRMDGPVKLYENPDALPNVFLVGCIQRTDNSYRDLPDLRPRQFALVEADLGLPQCANGADAGAARVVDRSSERIEVAVRATRSALLVHSDVFYPAAWTVQVDSMPAVIHRVNHMFRGVVVGPGEHRVVFTLAERSGWRGILVVLFGLAITWLLCIWSPFRKVWA